MGRFPRNSLCKQFVFRGKRSLKSEEAVLVTNVFGEKTIVFGPYVLRLNFSNISFLDRFTASSKQYLCITYKENPSSTTLFTKHVRGPCASFLLPSYIEIQVKDLIHLRDQDILCRRTVYGESFIRGPLHYMPETFDETLEVFNRRGISILSIDLTKPKAPLLEKEKSKRNLLSNRSNSFLTRSFKTFPSTDTSMSSIPSTFHNSNLGSQITTTIIATTSQYDQNSSILLSTDMMEDDDDDERNIEDVEGKEKESEEMVTYTANSDQYLRILSAESKRVEHKRGPCSMTIKSNKLTTSTATTTTPATTVQILDLISLKTGDDLYRMSSVLEESFIAGPITYMPEPSDLYGIVYRNGIKSLTVFYFDEVNWGTSTSHGDDLKEVNITSISTSPKPLHFDKKNMKNVLHELEFYRGKDKCLVWEH